MSFEDVSMQITIPDLDDDALYSTPIPFGRTPGGSGFGYGGTGSGQESPTAMTPLALPERAEKSYFHSRNDSVASEDSSQSFSTRFTTTSKTTTTSFGHSSSVSINATGNTPFTKKPSFASIRNAFKSGKSSEAPPVPPLDREAYPVLKNPFNRSNSSLAYAPPPSRRPTATTTSPPHGRPPTPGSDARYRTPVKSKGHTPARSQHSHTGSVFHSSDTGSDLGHGYYPSSSPPPLPRMPDAFSGQPSRGETPPLDFDDNVVIEPRTPAEYALHAIFMRFVAFADSKLDIFLKEPLDHDPAVEDFMGPGVDPKFDDLMNSLGKVAHKNAKPVIDSIMRWRRSHHGDVSSEVMRVHIMQSPSAGRGIKTQDSRYLVAERKSLASVYIMCRALIAIMQSISKDALGDVVGYELEDVTFEQFKTPYLKLLNQSGNHRINAELYATLLGLIANVRFDSVTDKFLRELQPVAAGQVPKDLDMKYESLIKGLRHVQIRVWPPEAFEEGAEFFESLSKSFANAHGFRLKSAFAETLVQILHPIGKTAQAEVNQPEWAKAIEVIHPKAKDMMSKPRYWPVAYPLVITSLCVAPQEYFLRNWLSCFEAGLTKLKDKPHRAAVLNGTMRLIWTYLYRCYEPASTATSKLDSLLKHFFPPNRQSIFPPDDHLDPFIHIVHFILSRHFDFGAEFCLELMQEQTINGSSLTNLTSILSPERLAVSVKAALMSLNLLEREERAPSWPSNADYSTFSSNEDYPISAAFLPETILQKPGVQDLVNRSSLVLAHVAEVSANAVIQMSVLDDQWSGNRLAQAYEESHNYVLHRHPEGLVAYPNTYIPQIGFLQTCFESWPRCLHSSLAVDDVLDMLVRGVIHVEPTLADAASGALHRFMESDQHALLALGRFNKFLFGPHCISSEGSGVKLTIESSRLLGVWSNLVNGWIHSLLQKPLDSIIEDQEHIIVAIDELEAGSLFLLTHVEQRLRSAGVVVLRALRLLVDRLYPETVSEPLDSEPQTPAVPISRISHLLHGKQLDKSYLDGYDDLIKRDEDLDRLGQWRQSQRVDIPLRIADSSDRRDAVIWEHVYPGLIRYASANHGHVVGKLREAVVAAVSRYHPLMAAIAGINSRVPTGLPARNQSGEKEGAKFVVDNMNYIRQWRMWMKIICSTASSDIRSNREHARVPSEANFDRERMTTTRGLFRLLAPFLDSEHTVFRDAAVLSISSFPSEGYTQLLDDLNNLAARQFYDDRFKMSTPPAPSRSRRQERFYAAVARIYYLTAHLILDQRSAARQAALSNILKFVRHTQAFLTSPESRDKYMLQRLRRYFCGAVERLFDGMATLKDSDRFVPYRMHLHLYRLCEEWCQLGPQSEYVKQRLIFMQKSSSDVNDPQKQAEGVRRFQTETKKLSKAAVGAMASVCAKAFFPPEMSSGSPTDNPQEPVRSLNAVATLDRWTSILASYDPSDQAHAKKAVRSLLSHPAHDAALMDEALRRAVVLSKDLDTSNSRFFEVVADVLCTVPRHGFAFSQIIWLGLFNLCHELVNIRRWALNVLQVAHDQWAGLLPLNRFEAAVGSSAPSTYLQAHRLISDVLAGEHPQYAGQVLGQFVTWMPRVLEDVTSKVHLLLLQSLEYWISNIDLMPNEKTHLSPEGRGSLYDLISLTSRYAESHSEQVLTLWTRLVDSPHQHNGHAAIRFLLEQSHKVGSSVYITCASKIVACLSQSVVGRQVFEDLCGLIEPERMLPTIDHKLGIPSADELEMWSDLDALFSETPRLSLGSAQFALLFLADVALERQWEQQAQLPVLLHALLVHTDHRVPFVRQRARYMLFQLLRTWTPGYEDLPDRSAYTDRVTIRSTINSFEQESESIFWRDDEHGPKSQSKMKSLCTQILDLLDPLHPNLADKWGSLALTWGTGCSIRAIAFRSLQVFRALMPHVTKSDLALLLGRLSSTIADEDENIQNFTVDIILTLSAISTSDHFDRSSLPLLFWSAYACLATTVEREYQEALVLLQSLLKKIDLNDKEISTYIISHRPRDWSGSASLQSSLLAGLRSSVTSGLSFSILQMLATVDDGELIDPSDGRVRDLYTASLPWLLHAKSSEVYEESLVQFSRDMSRLAEKEGKHSISRILDSFANRRFRTTEDFLRQSVSSLREHYGVDHWAEVVTLLLGLTLNNQRWLRVHSIQILKVLFQQRETRQPVDRLGSELLMPLLRLLETDLAPEALSVLEEPMTISGGPSAKHVLRMSMNIKSLRNQAEVTDIFGIPQESGWCVARPKLVQEICRANVVAIFDTCKVPTRPSRIDFQPEEVEVFVGSPDDNLGDLVQNLHELSMFFQEEDSQERGDIHVPLPTRQVEARVAAILAKSTDRVTDAPQTPFVDVFEISDLAAFGDSDEDSGSDSESDAFVFDSLDHLSISRSNSLNGFSR